MNFVSNFLFITVLACSGQAAEKSNNTGPEWNVRAASLLGTETYGLSAEGFSGSSGAGRSAGQQLLVQRSENARFYRITYSQVTSQFSVPSDLSPSEVQSELQKTQVLYGYPILESWFDSLRGFWGVEYRKRSAQETTPNIFLPTNEQAGVYLGFLKEVEWSNLWAMELYGGAFFPLYFRENTAKTGYRMYAIAPDLGVTFVYRLNHFLEFTLGAQAFYEIAGFSGTGERGSTNASESTVSLLVPVELRFEF